MTSLDTQTERFLPWLVAITFFMQMLDITIVNTALPAMATSLSASPLQMQSVSIAYVLTVAMLIPASGWITDKFGIRYVFMIAIILFTLGSLACALSTTLPLLVISRVLQGLGGAILSPVGRLSIIRVFPKDKLVQVLSLISVPALLGPLIGPALGGALVDYASWHWIFLINIPVGVIALLGTLKYMPLLEPLEAKHPLDWVGFFLFGFSMVFLTIGIQGIGELHLPLSYEVVLFMSGSICLAGYLWHSPRTPHPLFTAGLFTTRNFTIGIIGNITARLGMGAMPFMVPLFLQVGLGFTPLQAGFSLAPVALAAIFGKSLTKPLLSYFGYRVALTCNTLILGCLIASFSFLPDIVDFPYLRFAFFALFGAFNSIQFTIMNTLTLIDLPLKYASSGNSLLSVVMQMGVGLGVATAATILGLFTKGTTTFGTALVPSFIHTFLCLGFLTCIASIVFVNVHNTGISGSDESFSSQSEAKD